MVNNTVTRFIPGKWRGKKSLSTTAMKAIHFPTSPLKIKIYTLEEQTFHEEENKLRAKTEMFTLRNWTTPKEGLRKYKGLEVKSEYWFSSLYDPVSTSNCSKNPGLVACTKVCLDSPEASLRKYPVHLKDPYRRNEPSNKECSCQISSLALNSNKTEPIWEIIAHHKKQTSKRTKVTSGLQQKQNPQKSSIQWNLTEYVSIMEDA